jgi:hypothetical protein
LSFAEDRIQGHKSYTYSPSTDLNQALMSINKVLKILPSPR